MENHPRSGTLTQDRLAANAVSLSPSDSCYHIEVRRIGNVGTVTIEVNHIVPIIIAPIQTLKMFLFGGCGTQTIKKTDHRDYFEMLDQMAPSMC